MGELRGRDGFAKCLRLTLYRPRDLLALLNEAFQVAKSRSQAQLILDDVEKTGEQISQNRLSDLRKEYSAILPGLVRYLGIFEGCDPERDIGELTAQLESLLENGAEDPVVQQDFLILEDAKSVLRGLYSIGFIGVRDKSSGRYVFCHDGSAPDRDFSLSDKVLVHPCYWMAMNLRKPDEMEVSAVEDIYDEYDIEVASETPDIRQRKILALIDRLETIPEGTEGDSEFEAWVHKAIRICFVKSLRNVALKPNKLARQRRDVVGTNLGDEGAWQRIREDYGTRQVIFEVKNYKDMTAADYQQVQSYLSPDSEYGRLAFVVTRDDSVDLYAHRDVDWVREVHANHKVLIVKLTAKFFVKLLHKLRNPQKHDAVDDSIHKILDTYTRLYLAGQTLPQEGEKRLSRKKRRKVEAARAQAAKAAQVGQTAYQPLGRTKT